MPNKVSMPSQHIRRGRNCVFLLHAHLVFVTKYRHKVFVGEHLTHMETIFKAVCSDFEAVLIEFNGEVDHVHLLVNYPPKVSLAKLVNSLKGVSSRLLKKDHPGLTEHYWKGALWSPSYFAGSCGGASIETLRAYIEKQIAPS